LALGTTKTAKDTVDAGTILAGRYETIREIGRGGMGVVYLCRDTVTDERVALKRLRAPDESKSQSREEESWWFQQEARAVASLDHPAVVRARDFGTLADGSPYLVMDALPGRSVHEWMHTTQLPWAVVWALADQVMAGLAHAHARGIIHGDLKPSNVMLDIAANANARGPRAFVLDLGLAWLRESRHDPRLDGAPEPEMAIHAGAGTVGWVAPEQIRKMATHVGPATDLYALGCILYRVLSGREVFEGNAQEVLRAHKRTPVPMPVVPDSVPPAAAAFVVRLLEKKPWNRFELAADARRAWAQLKPRNAPTMEETMASMPAPPPAAPSSFALPERGRAVAAARALAPGLMSLRPSPMVARETERAGLVEMLENLAARKPMHQLLALIGEAGVGKSRLAEWFCEHCSEQGLAWVLRARYGRIATPLDGLTGAINKFYSLQGADRALVEQTLINRWEVEKDDDDALSWVAATAEWLRPTPPGEVLPLGPTGKRFVLDKPELRFAVIRRLLERIGFERPIVIWFDDLHLSSPNTFDVLHRIHREVNVPMLALATARSEALETDIDAALRMEALRVEWQGKVLDVKPLGDEETNVLLRATLPLHSEALQAATVQSRGNPLFALQLVHAWAGGGYLTMESGRYRVPREALSGRAITTAELWDERLRAVPTELRLAAYAAAAVGDDVRGVVLKALAQALGLDAREALMGLTRAQILVPSGSDQFRWAHALLQEHLLARLHERNDHPAIFRLAANALALHPSVGSRRVMKLRVTNLLRAGDDDVAAALMFRFIEAAWSRGRDTAATLRDLGVLEGRVSGVTAAEYALWRAEALRHTGMLEKAREHGEKALAYFQSSGDERKAATTMRLLGHIASDVGHPAQGKQSVEQAIQIFRKLGDARGLAQAMVVLGELEYLLGNHSHASEVLQAATASCRAGGDDLGAAQALILQAMIRNSEGGYTAAVSLLMEARVAFDLMGYRLGIAQCDAVLGHADHRARKFETAMARAVMARDAFRELVNPRGEAASERLLAMLRHERLAIHRKTH
jgi:eukaryotic-like serine/threonine-protein kinase